MKQLDEDTNSPAQKPPVNYVKLYNWFFDVVIYFDGCKSSYCFLFFAIVDSINRNNWRPVALPLDLLLNKAKLDKKTYLKGRTWLTDYNLLVVTPGKNNYQMATFWLGSAVEKSPAMTPSKHPGTPSGKGSSDAPAYPPATTPILYKQETKKQETEREVTPAITFFENDKRQFVKDFLTYLEQNCPDFINPKKFRICINDKDVEALYNDFPGAHGLQALKAVAFKMHANGLNKNNSVPAKLRIWIKKEFDEDIVEKITSARAVGKMLKNDMEKLYQDIQKTAALN